MKKLLLLSTLSVALFAGEGCVQGKLVKDLITGKITREVPKEVKSCDGKPEVDVKSDEPKSGIELFDAMLEEDSDGE